MFGFEIEPMRKRCLLEGLDDISVTLQSHFLVREYESERRELEPWLFM
jgi:3-isopropylmalate/(R)-2-methylmalate dehydratase small subunit